MPLNFSTSVIYDGAKDFWKSRINLGVLIVRHNSTAEKALSSDVFLEVICHNHAQAVACTRIYLQYTSVVSKIRIESINLHKKEKNDAYLLKYHQNISESEIHAMVVQELIVQYILSRLALVPNLPADHCDVYMHASFEDTIVPDTNKIDVECTKPDKLFPYEVTSKAPVKCVTYVVVVL